jgi:hypothetical protein
MDAGVFKFFKGFDDFIMEKVYLLRLIPTYFSNIVPVTQSPGFVVLDDICSKSTR